MSKTHRECLKGPRLVDIVRDLMTASGYPQKELAKRYGVSRSFIQDIVRDQHCPSADICQRIYEDLSGRPLMEINQ